MQGSLQGVGCRDRQLRQATATGHILFMSSAWGLGSRVEGGRSGVDYLGQADVNGQNKKGTILYFTETEDEEQAVIKCNDGEYLLNISDLKEAFDGI